MSDLVKTSLEIQIMLEDTLGSERNVHLKQMEKKFLVLPQGLDKLEEMLKKEIQNEIDRRASIGYSSSALYDALTSISSVFARFKKEHGIKEE
jgi:hypothetical protein